MRNKMLLMALTMAWFLTMPLAIVVLAQDAPAPAASASVDDLWADFIHYIRVANPQAALAYGQGLIQANPDPRVVYELSVKGIGVAEALRQGENLEGLGDTVTSIRELVEQGYQLTSRDPDEIARAIDLLEGGSRQFALGLERLQFSGEYAVPQLVQRLGDSKTSTLLRNRIQEVLPKLGRLAIRPICEALQSEDPVVRGALCQALGRMQYRQSASYLRTLIANPDELGEIKEAASAALVRVAGRAAQEKSVSGLFYELADEYYTRQESLLPDTRFKKAPVWLWRPRLGLTYQEVPVEIFMDVYAIRASRASYEADSSNQQAVVMFLTANLRRQGELPPGQKDPTTPDDQLSAETLTKAAGSRYAQMVLARALRDRDSAVAIGAIGALAGTAGGPTLIKPPAGGANPLTEALTYSNRRVRFMAAETLANARPWEKFNGDDLAITVLIEALRQTGQRTALLVEPVVETRNQVKAFIRDAGYDVIDADNYAAAVTEARKTTGVDMIVLSSAMDGPSIREAAAMVRSDPTFATLPLVILADKADVRMAIDLAKEDEAAVVAGGGGLDEAELAAALKQASQMAAGEQALGDAEAAEWALRAAKALYMLGLTNTQVFNIVRAEGALVAGLSSEQKGLPVACAQALSVLRTGTAQQAILGLANSNTDEATKIAAYNALADSVKLVGNQLTAEQAATVVEAVSAKTAEAVRDAASQLLGALSLPVSQINPLIIGGGSGE